MKVAKSFRLSTAVLFCLCAALSLGLIRGLTEAPGTMNNSGLQSNNSDWLSHSENEVFEKADSQSYPDISAYPLFNFTRRPVPKVIPPPVVANTKATNQPSARKKEIRIVSPPLPQKPSAPPLTGFRLLGVMMNEDLRQAVVQVDGSSEAIAVIENNSVLGWAIVQIGVDHIVLSHDLERRTFHLYDPKEQQAEGGKKIKSPKLESRVNQTNFVRGKVRLRITQ